MKCSICGHEFEPGEERMFVPCGHGVTLCPCGVYGYSCMSHQGGETIRMSLTHLPGDLVLETVSAGLEVLAVTMREPVLAGLMGSDEEYGL